MSWLDLLRYGKKHVENHRESEPRPDAGLPFGARIGSLLDIRKAAFIRAQGGGSLVVPPAPDEVSIQAISRVKLDGLSGKLYRYYLAKGDEGKEERFLQVYVDEAGDVAELLYCSTLTRFVPETEEDQALFTGRDGRGLGEQTFTLAREQLEGLDIDPMLLERNLNGADTIEYQREVPGPEFVAPFKGVETRLDDASGTQGLTQRVYHMTYVRDLATCVEQFLISTEIVDSQDGDTSRRAIHVDFMVGIPLEPDRVQIL